MSTKDTEFVTYMSIQYSLLDGCSRIDKLCSCASELGMKALDHRPRSALRATSFFKQAENMGSSHYSVAKSSSYEDELALINEERAKQKSRYMGLLARNFTGYQNLCKLVSKPTARASAQPAHGYEDAGRA